MSKKQYKTGDAFSDKFKNLKAKEIKDNLESFSYSFEEANYTRDLMPEDLVRRKNLLAEVSIKISEIEIKKKEANAEFKAELEGPKLLRSDLINDIKHRTERVEGTVFNVDDQENNVMYLFDDRGFCVGVRDLSKDEKQTKLKTINE